MFIAHHHDLLFVVLQTIKGKVCQWLRKQRQYLRNNYLNFCFIIAYVKLKGGATTGRGGLLTKLKKSQVSFTFTSKMHRKKKTNVTV